MANKPATSLTAVHLAAIQQWRVDGKAYAFIAGELSKQYGVVKTESALRSLCHRWGSEQVAAPDNSRILVISDMHVPFQHPNALRFLAAVAAKYKPTRIVCIGDEIDQHNLSFHDSDPDLPGAGDELKAAIREMQPLYRLFPEMDLIDSNHGSMIYRKGKHHGIPRKYLRDYGEVLDAPAGWRWHNDLIVTLPDGNTCYFHHGIAKDVMKVVALRGMCVVQGHYHTEFRIGYIGNPAALLWGMNVGCLIDNRSMAFAYDKTNLGRPVIGCAVVIDGQPKLLPMVLGKNHKWTGVVP